jgi:hypothetical protein
MLKSEVAANPRRRKLANTGLIAVWSFLIVCLTFLTGPAGFFAAVFGALAHISCIHRGLSRRRTVSITVAATFLGLVVALGFWFWWTSDMAEISSDGLSQSTSTATSGG